MDDAQLLIIIAVSLAAVELLAGVTFGWWLRGNRAAADGKTSPEAKQARVALEQLHELASNMAANVGEHSSRVQAISGELTAAQNGGGDVGAAVLGTVAQIIEANERMQQQLDSAKNKLDEQAALIEQHVAVAKTDALTGIANRRAFDEQLAQRLCEWQRKKTPLSLIMLDVDRFKQCNDTYGHQAGDELLKLVAQTLVHTMREMDVVARYGGEEFAIIVPSSKLREALPGAERARRAIVAASTIFDGKKLQVTASLGVSQAMEGEEAASLIRRADEALYAAKKNGRNRTFLHDGNYTVAAVEDRPVASTAAVAKTTPAIKKEAAATTETDKNTEHGVDDQTGLPTRTAFCEEVRRRLAESQMYNSPLALTMIKIDNFNSLIKTQGMAAGSAALRGLAKFLAAAVPELHVLGHCDQQTFGLLLPGMSLDAATKLGERLRQSVARCPIRTKECELSLTVSMGISGAIAGDDSTSLIKRAEVAASEAATAGGNCCYCHSGKTSALVNRMELVGAGA